MRSREAPQVNRDEFERQFDLRPETVPHLQAPQSPEISVPFTEISGSGVLESCFRFGAISFSPADNSATYITIFFWLFSKLQESESRTQCAEIE